MCTTFTFSSYDYMHMGSSNSPTILCTHNTVLKTCVFTCKIIVVSAPPSQESPMSLFLTSPRTSHDLVATHPPGPTPPTSHAIHTTTSPLPSMGALRLSEAHTTATLDGRLALMCDHTHSIRQYGTYNVHV